MITTDVICLLVLAFALGVGAICLLAYGIYSALTDYEMYFCFAMIVTFLCLSVLSGVMFNESHKEYKNAIPQNQIKILRQKISDAEKEYQKYLIDHPELKAKENYTK
jgi:cell division protein FtsL